MKKFILLLFTFFLAFTLACNDSRLSSDLLSDTKEITSFSFQASVNDALDADVTGQISGTDITATVPFGTDVSSLIATFVTTGESVTVGGTAQESGVTANDFTGVIEYTVTAADSSIAVYAVTISIAAKVFTVVNTQTVTASDILTSAQFGKSVAVKNSFALVGSVLAESESGTRGGAVNFFEKNIDGTWNETHKYSLPDAAINDLFGHSVAISGGYAIVGAPQREADDGAGGTITDAGAAYIYERNEDGTWTKTADLTAFTPEAAEYFGISVAICGDYAVVGTGVNLIGNRNAVYIFMRNSEGAWQNMQKLTCPEGDDNGYSFGYDVDINGIDIVIGAMGNKNNDNYPGAVYVYRLNAGTWKQDGEALVSSDLDERDFFGYSVALSGDYLIAGAPQKDPGGFSNAGGAYIFERSSVGAWTQAAILEAHDLNDNDNFGYTVVIDGGYAAVTAYGQDTEDGETVTCGGMYVYQRSDEGTWANAGDFLSPNPTTRGYFGYSLSISDAALFVGACGEAGTDSEGGPVSGSGVVYVYEY